MIYKTKGVCAQEIDVDVEGTKVKKVKFIKGCSGNLKAIGTLVEGMEIAEVINKLSGIKCGDNDTSCADQLAKALKEINL